MEEKDGKVGVVDPTTGFGVGCEKHQGEAPLRMANQRASRGAGARQGRILVEIG